MPAVSASRPWSVHRLPRADGKNFLVTGGNAGIGYFVAEQLAQTGATVVLGSRNAAKAEAALVSLRSRVPGAQVRHLPLDLADLGSLKSSADALAALGPARLDAVVHNAGVALDDPPRQETKDGHELMFGTNHLGHVALTRWLAPLLSAAPAARIVTVGSFAAKSERLDLNDPQSAGDYRPKRTYGRSKLAQMYFGLELDRRLRAVGSTVLSVVAHPGGALDSLTPARPPVHERGFGQTLGGLPAGLLVQGKDAGAWPAVRAVLDPEVTGGGLWGPRVFGLRGRPRAEPVWELLKDAALAERLWEISCDLADIDADLGLGLGPGPL
ncbi:MULTISPECIES: SDR family NAD(P)-dependent oxidoreductase [unclassified Streptomyces]|uniref:SDR family NAD(P)-dependent oxidoreductase n=1 Tax=unclassified Streptomyces TaxID=2593676 RepID=UPI002DD9B16E|nr:MULTISPECIES: SDR family NAD(P)-dependent oxidoreductase [unclassified Streptomyces]WSA91332.1 SDR family NAD(P)-dependent oxidoreductase [Streptomyces sp. NBC_01795]WSB75656.1 SDR family NAD(P)-dependent oxidoreductase [Streptomyces sp. NBC_01775]WSS16059.1 SDR family NAD(P)-dependent oxidoreductase [Streptomyces sp. NBC_01186]WSS44878.1 SDR family NAD(P)-dependent oxidoreductase [Streptomyces sp. NBC_01187]